MHKKVVTGILLLFSFLQLRATHYAGVDMYYETINCVSRIYRIHVLSYRDCGGAVMSEPRYRFCGENSSCPLPIVLSGWTGSSSEITPLCPSLVGQDSITTCSGGLIKGIQEHHFTMDILIPNSQCSKYKVVFNDFARNSADNIVNSTGKGILIDDLEIDISLNNCNNSPVFANPPAPFFCANSSTNEYYFNQGANDVDGDSLVYRINFCKGMTYLGVGEALPQYPCGTTNNYFIPYDVNNGFSTLQPFGTQYDLQLDSQTGDMTIIRTGGGPLNAVVCLYVDEYRDGVKIGTVVRDMQFTFYNCSQNLFTPVPDTTTLGYGGAGQALSFEKKYCLGDSIALNFCFSDGDGDSVEVTWDNGIPGASFTEQSFQIDPCSQFTWYPGDAGYAPGDYSFVVTAKDNGCPYFQQYQRSMKITIIDTTAEIIPLADSIDCYTRILTTTETNDSTLTYQWFIGANFIGNTDSLQYTFPDTGTYTCSVQISGICINKTISKTIIITKPNIEAGNDTTICSGTSISIGETAQTDMSYEWTPSNLVQNPTQSNPQTITFMNETAQIQVYTLKVSGRKGCEVEDSIKISVLPAPRPIIQAMPNDSVCKNENITLTANTLIPNTNLLWNGTQIQPSLTLLNQTKDSTIFVQAMYPSGCISEAETLRIHIYLEETATITNKQTGDTLICADTPLALEVSTLFSNSTVKWSTGDSTKTITFEPKNLQNEAYWDSVITVKVWNEYGCEGEPDSVHLYGKNPSEIDFFATKTELILPHDKATQFIPDTTALGNLKYINWNFGDGQEDSTTTPTHEYNKVGKYDVIIQAEDEYACVYTLKKEEYIEVKAELKLYIPNAFSPNGDEANDEFKIESEYVKSLNLKIYNRWGELLYETSGESKVAWTGEGAAEGMYLYKLQYTDLGDEEDEQSGVIYLMR